MLPALGFQPMKAAAVALVANTAPVAFGAIAIPIVTLSAVTGLPKEELGAMVGRQTPLLAVIVPLILVGMVDGRRGIRQVWPAALVGGSAFGLAQFVCSNYVSVELTDIVAALVATAAIVGLVRVWQPSQPLVGRVSPVRPALAGAATHDTPGEVVAAYMPYILVIAVFSIAQIGFVKTALASVISEFQWPGLHLTNPDGVALGLTTFRLNWVAAGGTLLLIAGLVTIAVLRLNLPRAARAYLATLKQLRWAILTVTMVLALAYVMNASGQTVTLGLWVAGAGGFFAFISAMIGWFGVAVTGSDTSSNSLFGALQVAAAKDSGLSPVLMAAANSSGGVLGKMISPQNLAIGAAAVGLAGKEGEIFRRVFGWSLVLLLAMCVIVYLQSTDLLGWMVVH
jgi:lactate permease